MASAIHTIFGLDNPYTKNNIVFARRACVNISSKLNENGTTNDGVYYGFVLGLPHADQRVSKFSDTETYKKGLRNFIIDSIWPSPEHKEEHLTTWVDDVRRYIEEGIADEGLNTTWIDKHLCPIGKWGDEQRKLDRKFCKYNLDNDNVELIGVNLVHVYNGNDRIGNTVTSSFISQMISAESSVVYPDDEWKDDSHAIRQSDVVDYTTITYRSGEETTGSLKIITLSNLFVNTNSIHPSKYSIAAMGGYILKSKKVFNVIQAGIKVRNGEE